MRLVSESGRKPPTVLPRPTASGHVNSVGQGDRPKRSGLKLGSCYFQNAREPDHDIISIATQAGAFVLFYPLAGGDERRAASGPSFAPRRRFLFALARLSFLSMIGGAEHIEVKSAVIGEHPQVIIAPPDHPLAKQRSISPREIAKQTILMREVGSGTRLLAERFLAQHGIEPRIGIE